MSESTTTSTDICANCGKDNATNTCNKCKMIKYCNAACKKKHRHKHKKDCEEHVRLAAERAAELHDEKLFKQPPPQYEDCPICFLRMPIFETGHRYYGCCGKVLCCGCIHSVENTSTEVPLCPFCRTPAPVSPEEANKRTEKRIEKDDAYAFFNLGTNYDNGRLGLPKDSAKALELWHRGGELGDAKAYHNIGCAYYNGNGVKRDGKKAEHYWELAAMLGHVDARYNLGAIEENKCNMDRALKHYKISAGVGHDNSLKKIKELFTVGHATKDDYVTALRAHQSYLNEIKSIPRDAAVAHHEYYKYY